MSLFDIALAVLGVGFLLSLGRAIVGPTLADRAAAVDVCFFAVVASLALLAVRSGTTSYVDAVLVATLLGFIATIAVASLVFKQRR